MSADTVRDRLGDIARYAAQYDDVLLRNDVETAEDVAWLCEQLRAALAQLAAAERAAVKGVEAAAACMEPTIGTDDALYARSVVRGAIDCGVATYRRALLTAPASPEPETAWGLCASCDQRAIRLDPDGIPRCATCGPPSVPQAPDPHQGEG